jgi:prevent-host-death family protein
MRSVNIAELKNHLSSYLNEVRGGGEILIRDRNLPIAKIVPIARSQDFDAELLALAAAGKARLPEETLPESFWSLPAPKVSMKKILAALRADRDED